MRRSARSWLLGGFPLLGVGIVLLMLLPGAPNSAARVAEAPAPVKAAQPSILAAAAAQAKAAPARVVTAALEVPLPTQSAPLALPIVSLLANKPIAADWSAYVGHDVAIQSPGSVPAGLADGKVGAQAVNARSGPNSSTDVQFVLQPGEPIKLGEINGSWRHVYRPTGESGWVFTRYIYDPSAPPPPADTTMASADQAPAADAPRPGSYLASRSALPVRSSPDASAALSFVLAPGERFQVQATRGSWMRVLTQDGYSGWIPG